MRINRTLIVFLCLSLVPFRAFAQTPPPPAGDPGATEADAPWRLVFFASGDSSTTDAVNAIVEGGYIPVGLEITPGENLGLLFVKSGSTVVESWAILDYDDWNALEGEITGGIRDGFVPMDISRYDETLAVLWVRADLPLDGWRISTSPNTVGDRTRKINEFQTQGFTLWGMSVHEGLAWYLFVKQPGTSPAGAVSAFTTDTMLLQSGIVDASRSGWLPNGLASADQTTYICFIR